MTKCTQKKVINVWLSLNQNNHDLFPLINKKKIVMRNFGKRVCV